jgi:ABC-type transporter Mla subunit MlaD
MKRILLSALVVLVGAAFLITAGGASNGPSPVGNYTIQLDNAFGIVTGADFKVAGVRAGSITGLDLDQKTLRALVHVSVTQPGFGQFHSDVFCQSRPQSLIGEYFVECDPGSQGPILKPGSVIPVSHTQSTIPADLLQDVMRMPYRQRLTLIINELGAGVAGRSTDLQDALRRAVPALTQTDNLLNVLANDSGTIQNLTSNADSVITALADNSVGVRRFITEANTAATASAARRTDLQATFHKLPAFLEQLRPTLAQLGAATDANLPAVTNLNAASGQLTRLFTDLPGFSQSALPALRSLGQASVTGKQAVIAATPTIAHLNAFAKPTPELAQNLSIVLRDLDNRGRAVEKDPRSPTGQGFTGLEALLQYAFQQTLAVNTFTPFGHVLALDVFASPMCSSYSSSGSLAIQLKLGGQKYRDTCYSWLGPIQPGINVPDPSNPTACIPDPGGEPSQYLSQAPHTSACKLAARDTGSSATTAKKTTKLLAVRTGTATQYRARGGPAGSGATSATTGTTGAAGTPGSTGSTSTGAPTGSGGKISLGQTIGQLLGLLGGATGNHGTSAAGPAAGSSDLSGQSPRAPIPDQAQKLLNYLLSP